MATIQNYQSVNGATLLMVRYRQPNNKTTMKRRFTTKRDAKAFANKVEVDKTTGSYVAPTTPVFPRVTSHDLRHTAASLAISAGANPKVVQRMLGQASAAMTLDVYADLFESDVDAVADRLEDVLISCSRGAQ
jgi:integrase